MAIITAPPARQLHAARVALEPADNRTQAGGRDGETDEGHRETERVHREQRGSPHAARGARRQGEDAGEHRTDARHPADGERHSQRHRAGGTGADP